MSVSKEAAETLKGLLQKPNRFPVLVFGVTIGTADEWFVDQDEGDVLVVYWGFKPSTSSLLSAGAIAIDFEEGEIYPVNEDEASWEVDYDCPISIVDTIIKELT